MPSSFSSLDTGFPNLNKYGSTEQKLQAIESYLVQLLEQLRYTLNNLSQDNFNTKEVTGWLGQVVTEPIRVAIQDAEEQIYTQIDVTAEGVKSTVAQGTHQYDESGVSGGINYYGYGDPTLPAAGNSGKKYLDQLTGYYWTCNGSTWTKYSTALPLITSEKQDSATLISTINQTPGQILSQVIKVDNNTNLDSYISQLPNDITLAVKGGYANEWTTANSKKYYKNDVVKVTATSGGTTTVKFYKNIDANSPTTATNANKPGTTGGASIWSEISNPNVQSVIDLNMNGITLLYDNTLVESSDHNASYIKLTKDGTEIAGGKVFIKDLDASTITTGTLDASKMVLKEEFTAQAEYGGVTYNCGTIGAIATYGANNMIRMTDATGRCSVYVGAGSTNMTVTKSTGEKMEIYANESGTHCVMRAQDINTGFLSSIDVSPTGITAKKEQNGTVIATNNIV